MFWNLKYVCRKSTHKWYFVLWLQKKTAEDQHAIIELMNEWMNDRIDEHTNKHIE